MTLRTKPFVEQVALVTGGGTGIGRAFAESLSRSGARIVIASRREEVLKRTADELNAAAGAERVSRTRSTCARAVRAGRRLRSNMARTLLYALSLDRDVVLEDISLYSRG